MAAFNGSAPALAAVLAGVMAAPLAGASLPAPTSAAWVRATAPASGARALGAPAAVALTRAGVAAPGHDAQWFERIHVLPREVVLAYLLSEQVVPVEVWCAYRGAGRSLSAVSVGGTAGVTVDTPPSPPLWMPPLHADAYSVRVLTSGDALIANVVTWVFAGLDPNRTTLDLTGLRLVPWPFEPDMGAGFVETRGYASDVFEAYDVTEQRASLRERPMRGFDAEYPLLDERSVQFASALLQAWQTRPFGVPLWQYRAPLQSALGIGDDLIDVDTDGVPWADGDSVMLWSDPYTWEVASVVAFSPGVVQMAVGAARAWPVGTVVLPLAIGRLDGEQPFSWADLRVGGVRLPFSLEAA